MLPFSSSSSSVCCRLRLPARPGAAPSSMSADLPPHCIASPCIADLCTATATGSVAAPSSCSSSGTRNPSLSKSLFRRPLYLSARRAAKPNRSHLCTTRSSKEATVALDDRTSSLTHLPLGPATLAIDGAGDSRLPRHQRRRRQRSSTVGAAQPGDRDVCDMRVLDGDFRNDAAAEASTHVSFYHAAALGPCRKQHHLLRDLSSPQRPRE